MERVCGNSYVRNSRNVFYILCQLLFFSPHEVESFRFEVLTMVSAKITVLWGAVPFSLVRTFWGNAVPPRSEFSIFDDVV